MIWFSIFLIITILILVNAIYVAAEFSTISARRSRLSQEVDEGNKIAEYLLDIIENPKKLDEYVASCQVGITISSLTLGYFGPGRIADALQPFFMRVDSSGILATSLGATIILIFLTFFQALLGELVPKNIGLQYPEKLAKLTVAPMRWSMVLFRPLIWLFNGSGNLIMRTLGLSSTSEHAHIHSPEEIIMLVEESGEGGILNRQERSLLKNTLELSESNVKDVMIPRTQLLAAPSSLTCTEMLKLVAESNFSRIPVYENSIDNISGIIHLKDLLCSNHNSEIEGIKDILRPVAFIPETMSVKGAFTLLQKKQFHIAVVLDEYGGTGGMVTIEDLLEEIFGEIHDEFDNETAPLRFISEDTLWIRGDFLIEDLNEMLDLNLPTFEINTIGGLMLNTRGEVPQVGEIMALEGLSFKIVSMRGRGVAAVTVVLSEEQIQELKGGTSWM